MGNSGTLEIWEDIWEIYTEMAVYDVRVNHHTVYALYTTDNRREQNRASILSCKQFCEATQFSLIIQTCSLQRNL